MNLDDGILELDRCPHCGRARPTLNEVIRWAARGVNPNPFQGILNWQRGTGPLERPDTYQSKTLLLWGVYECTVCHRLVMVAFNEIGGGSQGDSYRLAQIIQCWPDVQRVSPDVPQPARQYLLDSIESPPTTALIGAASALDAMLKAKGYVEGKLSPRIEQAAKDHIITGEMKAWADEIRVVANEQRHADMGVPLPDDDEKRRTLEFAFALAEFLFVLPEMIRRGRTKPTPQEPKK